MNHENKMWESIKQSYLNQISAELKAAGHPRPQEIVDDVSAHLEQKFAQLPLADRTWENLQKIITDMGPAPDYAELFDKGGSVPNRNWADKRFVLIGLGILAIIAIMAIALPALRDFHPFRITDRIDYPFVNDPQVLGKWVSVDFVQKPEDFTTGEKHWSDDLYLKELRFFDGGTTGGPWRWTKGLVLHPGDKTAAQYTIKTIDGIDYMFFEWKSGDYSIRHQKPCYYVLKKEKEPGTSGHINIKNTKGMEFLSAIPEFRDLHLGMTELDLKNHIKQFNLLFNVQNKKDGVLYHLFTENGENVIVMFNSEGVCSGIQRMQPNRGKNNK